jgi:hypothetical protein
MVKAKAKQVTQASEEKAPEAVLSFEDFLANHTVHPGLVASFTCEERNGGDELKPRTEQEWIHSLEEQSNRTY